MEDWLASVHANYLADVQAANAFLDKNPELAAALKQIESSPGKPTIDKVREVFAAYHMFMSVWGSLHIVLEDGNVADEDVRFCIERAEKDQDSFGLRLGQILLRMSRTQRLKLGGFSTMEYLQPLK